jgi:hypothetical protein
MCGAWSGARSDGLGAAGGDPQLIAVHVGVVVHDIDGGRLIFVC